MLVNRKRYLLLILIVAFAASSTACVFTVKDAAKTTLYAVKEEAVAVREYVITEYLAGRIDNTTLVKYKALDDKFTRLYRLTVSLYLAGNNPAGVTANTKMLQDLLLEIRKAYYPKGG